VLAIIGFVALLVIALSRGEPISALWIVAASVSCFLVAYRYYALYIGRRVLRLDPARPTPAVYRSVRRLWLDGELSDEQRQRLIEIAEKCPVHRTLGAGAAIETAEGAQRAGEEVDRPGSHAADRAQLAQAP
jgi:hypothetical protein